MQLTHCNYVVNRIDEFVFFRRLSRASLRDIVHIRPKELHKRLDDRRINLRADDGTVDWLVEASYDPRYGARFVNVWPPVLNADRSERGSELAPILMLIGLSIGRYQRK